MIKARVPFDGKVKFPLSVFYVSLKRQLEAERVAA